MKYMIMAFLAIGLIFNVAAMDNSDLNQYHNTITLSDDYERIESSELTPAVVEELLKQYPTSKLGAAYRNSKGEFKLIMVLKSGTRRTVYIDPYGNWINKK
ncbi:hypothetical protein [Maribacter aestuarii]|uniref:hypothetical protein n=1 Tax=Maribacter aestuarii TaxID=1130723 RepID=UPI00248B932B|nr:hypothetical protein [Maribacter aestuarii]